MISADGVTFVLRDYSNCHYVEEDAISPLWKGQRFPMTSCISGWAMMNNKTAVIPDIFADDRIPHEVYRKTFVKSLVMAPVGFDTPDGRHRRLLARQADHHAARGERGGNHRRHGGRRHAPDPRRGVSGTLPAPPDARIKMSACR